MYYEDPNYHPDAPMPTPQDMAVFERLEAVCDGYDVATVLRATSRLFARAIEGLPNKIAHLALSNAYNAVVYTLSDLDSRGLMPAKEGGSRR